MKKITLKSGRVVAHKPRCTCTSGAVMLDGGEMSESEWEEYCAILIKRNAAKIRRQERDSAMRDCGLTKVRGSMGGTFWE